MSSRTLRRLARRQTRRPSEPVIQRLPVVAINAAAKTVTVERPDGSRFALYTIDGTLPAVGDRVAVLPNNGDPVALSSRVLVDGTRQSPSWDGPDSTVGWGFTADGKLYAAEGIFRGDVTGARLRTAETGPRVEITGGALSRLVRFFSGAADEWLPGSVEGYDDDVQSVIQMLSPALTTGTRTRNAQARVRLGIDRVLDETFLDLIADNLRVNGTSISKPPYSKKRRTTTGATFVSHASDNAVVLFNDSMRVHHESAITFDGGTGAWRITRPGIYILRGILAWDDAGNTTGGRRLLVTENGGDRLLDTRRPNGTDRTTHNFNDEILVDSSDLAGADYYTVQIKAGHNAGGPLALTGRASVSWWSEAA